MTGTLRDRLAAVLGPGNDDATAYARADSVLEVLRGEQLLNAALGLLVLHASRNEDETTADAARALFDEQAPVEYWSVKGATQYGFPEQRLIHDLPSRDTADRWAADFLKRARQSGYEPVASVHKQDYRYGRNS